MGMDHRSKCHWQDRVQWATCVPLPLAHILHEPEMLILARRVESSATLLTWLQFCQNSARYSTRRRSGSMPGLDPRGDSALMLPDASCTPEFVMRLGLKDLQSMSSPCSHDSLHKSSLFVFFRDRLHLSRPCSPLALCFLPVL